MEELKYVYLLLHTASTYYILSFPQWDQVEKIVTKNLALAKIFLAAQKISTDISSNMFFGHIGWMYEVFTN